MLITTHDYKSFDCLLDDFNWVLGRIVFNGKSLVGQVSYYHQVAFHLKVREVEAPTDLAEISVLKYQF